MSEEVITKNEAVIKVLLDGGAVNSVDVAQKVTEEMGLPMSDGEATSLLSKLQKTELGYFIERRREGRRYFYEMLEEATHTLTLEQARGLSLKRGKDRYSLEQAVEEYPELGSIVEAKQAEESLQQMEEEEAAAPEEETVPEFVEAPVQEAEPPAMAEETGAFPGMDEKEDLLTELLRIARSGIKVDVTHDVRVTIKFE